MAIKMKTHSGAKKRFKVVGAKTKRTSAAGESKNPITIKFRKAGKNHLIKNKSKGSQQKGENTGLVVDRVNFDRVRRLLCI